MEALGARGGGAGIGGGVCAGRGESMFLWMGMGAAAVYAAVSLAVSLQIAAREREPRFMALLPVVFAVRHFVHGIGTLFWLLLVILPGDTGSRRGMKA